MKPLFTAALALTVLATVAYSNDTGTVLVPNSHGGYNVAEASALHNSIPFFGMHGFASHVIAHAHDKPKFIIQPHVQDDGHGNKHTVYQKVFFATAEEAEAAKMKQ